MPRFAVVLKPNLKAIEASDEPTQPLVGEFGEGRVAGHRERRLQAGRAQVLVVVVVEGCGRRS